MSEEKVQPELVFDFAYPLDEACAILGNTRVPKIAALTEVVSTVQFHMWAATDLVTVMVLSKDGDATTVNTYQGYSPVTKIESINNAFEEALKAALKSWAYLQTRNLNDAVV
ncbi:hypothetical protein pEaSNUABM42_00002 [Erwinia phage pEa_SNUABM_42]|nr:hypothetical protein pEaSNUABM43_00002 [Erwinia phage pEa_SNUABM_43]QVW55329.1 hypothetical protein pEaSNUABM42_00002 [Erwinia phage pEa_SNUABM_42]